MTSPRYLLSAQACGFGPVSKLSAVARYLPKGRHVFAGDGIALDFARKNSQFFPEIVECDPADYEELRHVIATVDAAFIVMNADLAFWATRQAKPTYFFDSLFSFWITSHDPGVLVDIARRIRRASLPEALELFTSLTPHERIVAAHVLSTRSFVQRFPGVEERAGLLRELGVTHIELTGPMVDDQAIDQAIAQHETSKPPSRGKTMLVNLGGFKNFLLDLESKDAYLRVTARFFEDFLREREDFASICVCGGAYAEPRHISVGGRTLDFVFLSHPEFLLAMSSCDVYLCTPGLTALHETLKMGRLPLFLPEEHYGHTMNVAALGATRVGRRAIQLREVLPEFPVPHDDFDGTAAIVSMMEAIAASEAAYAQFRRRVLDGIEQHLAVADPEEELRELRELLDGPRLADVIATVSHIVKDASLKPEAALDSAPAALGVSALSMRNLDLWP